MMANRTPVSDSQPFCRNVNKRPGFRDSYRAPLSRVLTFECVNRIIPESVSERVSMLVRIT